MYVRWQDDGESWRAGTNQGLMGTIVRRQEEGRGDCRKVEGGGRPSWLKQRGELRPLFI